jgi:gamma-glutamyltranspeptidase / glutathione hydrolase
MCAMLHERQPPSRLRRAFCERGALALALGLLFWVALPEATLRADKGGRAVASEAPAAAEAAMAVLRRDGNAADAAVTAALVAGVVSPSSSGLGGGCFIHVWNAATKQAIVLDARETAPGVLNNDAFEARPFGPAERGRWVGVPGELHGLYELHRRFGKRPWAELVQPAIQAAASGFVVGEHLARAFVSAESDLLLDPGLSTLWLRRGSAPQAGAKVRNPALASTLRRIAAAGPNAFYEGSVAADIVSTVKKVGGGMDVRDLREYRTVERQPLMRNWGGYEVHTMPPPSAGGMMLLQALALYTPEELRSLGFGSAAYLHALAESFRGSLSDRLRFLGDPDFVPVDVPGLLSESRMRTRRQGISMERTHAIPRFDQPEHGTHHLVTADGFGNVVSLTTTVNRAFGAKLTAVRSGVVLNDELDDFTSRAAVQQFGMLESPNRARARARPVSSMTPTLVVKDGSVVLAAGGSGGMNIATDVSQMVIAALTFDMSPEQLLATPRFQVPTRGATMALPADTPEPLRAELQRRGERLHLFESSTSAVQIIKRQNGQLQAGADARKFGRALAE